MHSLPASSSRHGGGDGGERGRDAGGAHERGECDRGADDDGARGADDDGARAADDGDANDRRALLFSPYLCARVRVQMRACVSFQTESGGIFGCRGETMTRSTRPIRVHSKKSASFSPELPQMVDVIFIKHP